MEANKKSRTERKKEETRKKILAVAMDLFKRQGFDKTTVDQIAMEADVAKGTVFNHFPEKEAIIVEHVKRVIGAQGVETIEYLDSLPDTRTRLIAALQKSLEWMHVDLTNDLFERYYTYKMSKVVQAFRERDPGISSGFRTILQHILELGKESGEIRPDISIADNIFLAAQLEFHLFISAIVWLNYPELISINERIERDVEFFLKGVENKSGDS